MTSRPARLALLVALVLLVPRAAGAYPTGTVKTSVTIPFSGVVFHPATNENVSVTGTVAVKTLVKYIPPNPIFPNDPVIPPNPIKIKNGYKLAKDATAIGQTTAGSYMLKGTSTLKFIAPSDPFYPNNPVRSLTQYAYFTMIPGNPVVPGDPIKTVRVRYQLNFDENGALTASQAVIVPEPAIAECVPLAAVCASPQPLLCTDDIKNQDETDVDCGGATCSARCLSGQSCKTNADCVTGVCLDVGSRVCQ
jgi:hypothetical protein